MILLASSNLTLLARWKQGISGAFPVELTYSTDLLDKKLSSIDPEILFLDYDLPGLEIQHLLPEWLNFKKKIKVVIFCPELTPEVEWKLFKIGIKGCCPNNMQPERIQRVIEVILTGELWIRRTLTNHILNELVKVTEEKDKIKKAVGDLLENLTRREYEIALLVGRGESNKKIAQQLAITERTVKAHLTGIFRKLQISDRINLALIMKDAIRFS